MRNIARSLSIVLVMLLLTSTLGFAGGRDRVGSSSGVQLMIPVGARYMAMSGAATAVATGVESIYWNPAGVARSDNAANAMFSHMTYIADMSVNFMAAEANLSPVGHVGFAIKSLAIGEIEITTADNPEGTGQYFSPTFFTLTFNYGRMLTDRVAFGVNVNLLHEQVPRVGATAFAFDAGIQYSNFANIEGLDFGIAIKNIGPAMSYDGTGLIQPGSVRDSKRPTGPLKLDPASFELPSTLEMGLAYTYGLGDMGAVTGSYVFQNNNFYADDNKIAVEYAFDNRFFVRGGYTMGMDVPSDWDYIYGPTFGAGFIQKMSGVTLCLDYAYRTVDIFDANHVFAVKLGF